MVEQWAAHNYHPLPVVVAKADGVWVEDADGKRYMDMLGAYSAVNFGHSHPDLLANAAHGLIKEKPSVLVDGGVENYNSAVDELVDSGVLRILLARTDISFSHSLIESWWRALKHQWLFLNTLDTVTRLDKLVTYYVDEHNSRLPHSAFRGQTPDEMYFETGDEISEALESATRAARNSRMELNRATSCPVCRARASLAS